MNRTIYLRTVCILGALIDAFFGIALLVPQLWATALGLNDFQPDIQHRLDMAIGAMLMFGWTILLLWVQRNPLERRFVFSLTAGVIGGLGLIAIIRFNSGSAPTSGMLHIFILLPVLFGLFSGSHLLASKSRLNNPEHETGIGR